jgi:copper ion binding protein
MRHTYSISGMTCNGCRSHVEKTLKEVPGVSDVTVDLDKAEAVINMAEHIEVSELRRALKESGGNYDIAEKHSSGKNNTHKKTESSVMTHTYHVEGMTCNGCRTHVEKTLNSVEGIKNASVDLKSGVAVITMEKDVDLDKLQEALQSDGGKYRISQPEKATNNEGKEVIVQEYIITGMTCNGCRSHVEKILSETDGVRNADVNLERNTARVEMQEYIEIDKFREAFKQDGGAYNIFLPGEDHSSQFI